MSAALPLLALLEQEPAHGYTLKQRYDDRFSRTRPLAFGQVYAALSRFETKGWAEVAEVEVVDGPERKRYRITEDGVEAITEWVYTPQQPTEFAMSNLYTRVSVALTSGRSAAEVLDRQRVQHLARMRELTQERKTATPAAQLAITYELAHLDADLRWIEEAGTRLEDLR
ncbi:PadR family transcriptional regulator [Nocardioides endophyticus]|jgi:DNA-binding PadR family transcriptional regulator|uniref:PadR family transcriptional regulator n=1 Tax=Nocardioides endophyticus TaxID=1353775 RepID=A0ABP8YMW9_9ACTN